MCVCVCVYVCVCVHTGLVALLNESSEETLHLVLETLEVVVKNDSTCVVRQVRVCV